ncbi:signal peptide-containing protein [Theileria equi strain WA]|uniref:Signal peptide-containing protein n=1 Tax=Theileria equi strain WA TaxID=1537102 RepID=L0AYQ3_THEEQ|nr:signal peptide-containing protein [Theileria equi strain WA]AFZ80014.1 signal peptide-containing protein [Theileria equi strain WA]|eukprot:XP_004829680.1 signal peptide-containing protein [Theileria equi strain WA]
MKLFSLSVISLLGSLICKAYVIDISKTEDTRPGIIGLPPGDGGPLDKIIDGLYTIWIKDDGQECINIDKRTIGDITTLILYLKRPNQLTQPRYMIKRSGAWTVVERDEFVRITSSYAPTAAQSSAIPKIIDAPESQIPLSKEEAPITRSDASTIITAQNEKPGIRIPKEEKVAIPIAKPLTITTPLGTSPVSSPKKANIREAATCSPITLDISSLYPSHATIHEGRLGNIIQRTYIPEDDYIIMKIVERYSPVWEGSSNGATSVYVYIRNGVAELFNMYIQGERRNLYFVKYERGWVRSTKMEFDGRYEALHKEKVLLAPVRCCITLDVLDIPDRAIEIRKVTDNIVILEPVQETIVNKLVEGKTIIWIPKDAGKCISATFTMKEDKPQYAELVVEEEGRVRTIYLERRFSGWIRITKEEYDSRAGRIEEKKDGFLTNTVYIIPFLFTVVSFYI